MNSMYSILEKINALQIKLDGVSATAFTIAKTMEDNKSFMPSINLIGLVVDEVTDELKKLVAEGHEINRQIREVK
ncbi:hypothetical protein SAMN02910355_0274 [Terrisporobacter glycolicus]|nr:hypothetical protein SAMN02910355_0274 [Terrisporobacter glycolicus]